MPGGQFTLGGRNASLYDGDVAFVPIDKTQNYWTIPVLSLMRRGGGGANKTVPSAPSQRFAMVDTGTTLIVGPAILVDSFFDGAPGALRGSTVDSSLNGTWLLRESLSSLASSICHIQ
jgi:cathepsin D